MSYLGHFLHSLCLNDFRGGRTPSEAWEPEAVLEYLREETVGGTMEGGPVPSGPVGRRWSVL